MKTHLSELMGHSKGSPNRKVYSHEYMYRKHRKISNNDLMLYLKLLEKQEQAKPKTSRRREIIKLRAKINK
jgi:tRNA splicing ligase